MAATLLWFFSLAFGVSASNELVLVQRLASWTTNVGSSSSPKDAACSGTLSQIKAVTATLEKEQAALCWQTYFSSLGPATQESDFQQITQEWGQYTGTMYWFAGDEPTFEYYQTAWDGVDFFGNGTCMLTMNPGHAFLDYGVLRYKASCPQFDSYPCLTIDWTAGALPRTYYTRKVSDTEYVSFVEMAAGGYSDVNVLEIKPDPCSTATLADIKALTATMDKNKSFECWKTYFISLGTATQESDFTPISLNSAHFMGTMYWFAGEQPIFEYYQTAWDGVQFFGNDTCMITLNPGFEFPPDYGTLSYKASCPQFDHQPCLTIDWTAGSLPRTYYTRKASETEYVSFVELASGGYSDVNVLEMKPDPCSIAPLDEMKALTSTMSKNRSLECWKTYFSSLGPATQESDFQQITQESGDYVGTMYWFAGDQPTFEYYQTAWDGVDFFGNGTCMLTMNPGHNFPDYGVLRYKASCPQFGSYPCLTIDWTAGALPRTYYTRKASDTEYVSFVEMAAGGFSDVNVLEKKPHPCSTATLPDIKALTATMDKTKSFECWKIYFTSLGPATQESDFLPISQNPGNYMGTMYWFAGDEPLFEYYQTAWDGVQFFGNDTCMITLNDGFDFPPDYGVLGYTASCPQLDNQPCLTIDWTSGSLPRTYYTRRASETEYVSFVELDSGAFSDVNVLQKYKVTSGKDVACKRPITTRVACKQAALELGWKWDGTRSWNNRLSGCLKTNTDTDVNFNTVEAGLGLSDDQTPLCYA